MPALSLLYLKGDIQRFHQGFDVDAVQVEMRVRQPPPFFISSFPFRPDAGTSRHHATDMVSPRRPVTTSGWRR